MSHVTPLVALLFAVTLAPSIVAMPDGPVQGLQPAATPLRMGTDGVPITIRPSTLAQQVSELAGHAVRLPYARVVGVFEPNVFLIETDTRFRPFIGNRQRVVVLIDRGALRVSPASLVSSTVTVLGVARTLLGMQVTREVPWPSVLNRDLVERLEIRAAVLATSVQTAEGVELTDLSPRTSQLVIPEPVALQPGD
jgi:hypothetical protein